MKGGGGGGGGVSSYSSFPSAKRGWRGLVIAVFFLVILSMFVPLGFLLGLHNTFHFSEQQVDNVNENHSSTLNAEDQTGIVNLDPVRSDRIKEDKDNSQHIDDLLKRLGPPRTKDAIANSVEEISRETAHQVSAHVKEDQKQEPHMPRQELHNPHTDTKNEVNVVNDAIEPREVASGDEMKLSCELEFGSYCYWCQEHKEVMKDSMVKQMKDKLFLARSYFPTIAKLPAQQKFSREMKQTIQEFEKILSESTTDADLPPLVEKKLQKMGDILSKAKAFPMDCNYVHKKLRQILDQTDDEAHFHMKQSAFLYQLAVQTMPKSLHCLSMRLTVEYFRSNSLDMELLPTEKYSNPELHHYVILSNNLLSSSVVINSTVTNSKGSQNQVFHVVTDTENFYSMKLWFYWNSYKEATVHVLNIDDVDLGYHDEIIPRHLSLPEEYRVFLRNANPSSSQMNAKYISLFGHTHFLLPEIFPKLKRVIILDDDVVVQHDLSPLWSLQLDGKVNGAVQFCDIQLNQLKGYLGEDNYNQYSCSWMSGLNIIDFVSWRELNLTGTYRRLLQAQNTKAASERVGSFPANLLTFQDLVYTLDSSWALSGLGHNYSVNSTDIEKAAVLHYNGQMKPWLELGIQNYKVLWNKYMKRGDLYMGECNVNP